MNRFALPTVRLLLAGSSAFALLAVAVAMSEPTPTAVSVLIGALLVSVALGWWLLHCATAERGAMQAELAQAAGRLEQTEGRLKHFVDGLAHEIKTPLTILSTEAQLLCLRSNDQVAVLAHGKTIAGYLMHFSGLVDGFIRLAGPSGSPEPRHDVLIAVHDLVVAAVHRAESMANSRGVRVVTTLAESGTGTAPEVRGDRVLLEAMIESLVRHAVYSSPREACVAVLVETAGETLRLSVRDQGAAIAPADLESAFAWASAPSATTGRGGGPTGGLAIALRIAAHHGGTISLRNLPEGGCEFAVTLPQDRAGRQPLSPVGEPEGSPAPDARRTSEAESPRRTPPR